MKTIKILTTTGELTVPHLTYVEQDILNSNFTGYITIQNTPTKIREAFTQGLDLLNEYTTATHIGDDTWFDDIPDLIGQLHQLAYHMNFKDDQCDLINKCIAKLNQTEPDKNNHIDLLDFHKDHKTIVSLIELAKSL